MHGHVTQPPAPPQLARLGDSECNVPGQRGRIVPETRSPVQVQMPAPGHRRLAVRLPDPAALLRETGSARGPRFLGAHLAATGARPTLQVSSARPRPYRKAPPPTRACAVSPAAPGAGAARPSQFGGRSARAPWRPGGGRRPRRGAGVGRRRLARAGPAGSTSEPRRPRGQPRRPAGETGVGPGAGL